MNQQAHRSKGAKSSRSSFYSFPSIISDEASLGHLGQDSPFAVGAPSFTYGPMPSNYEPPPFTVTDRVPPVTHGASSFSVTNRAPPATNGAPPFTDEEIFTILELGHKPPRSWDTITEYMLEIRLERIMHNLERGKLKRLESMPPGAFTEQQVRDVFRRYKGMYKDVRRGYKKTYNDIWFERVMKDMKAKKNDVDNRSNKLFIRYLDLKHSGDPCVSDAAIKLWNDYERLEYQMADREKERNLRRKRSEESWAAMEEPRGRQRRPARHARRSPSEHSDQSIFSTYYAGQHSGDLMDG